MESKELAPVAIFTYNRVKHIKDLIQSLLKNKEAGELELFIFSDGPKSVKDEMAISEVRQFIDSIEGFKSVVIAKQEKNRGLANSIISGVSSVFEKYEKIIVLEDDLVVSSNFISFMNGALDYYKEKDFIFSISGYCAPIQIPESYKQDVFFYYRTNSWGWGSWKDRWEKVDWEVEDFNDFISNPRARKHFNRCGEDCTTMLLKQMTGKINSWAIRFAYTSAKNNCLNIFPSVSKVNNNGADGSGTHVSATHYYETLLDNGEEINFTLPELNPEIVNNYQRFFKRSVIRKTINFYLLYKYLIKNKLRLL